MAKIEMREDKHLWVTFNPQTADPREVIIDEEHKDVRLCDGQTVVKVRWQDNKIRDVLVNDVFVYP